jgi:hypothetical protein
MKIEFTNKEIMSLNKLINKFNIDSEDESSRFRDLGLIEVGDTDSGAYVKLNSDWVVAIAEGCAKFAQPIMEGIALVKGAYVSILALLPSFKAAESAATELVSRFNWSPHCEFYSYEKDERVVYAIISSVGELKVYHNSLYNANIGVVSKHLEECQASMPDLFFGSTVHSRLLSLRFRHPS